MKIVKIIFEIYAIVQFLTLYALVACTTGTPQHFPCWFSYGMYISIAGAIMFSAIGLLYLIYWTNPGKRLGVIKGEQICKMLRK